MSAVLPTTSALPGLAPARSESTWIGAWRRFRSNRVIIIQSIFKIFTVIVNTSYFIVGIYRILSIRKLANVIDETA